MPNHSQTDVAEAVIDLRGAGKSYGQGSGRIEALSAVDLRIERGEFVAITGQSGSGKTTLLNLLAGIDRASSGRVAVAGVDLASLSERALTAWRGRQVGIVFQFFQLLPTLTVLENVVLPMDFCDRWPSAIRRARALELLDKLGVADQANKLPLALSGGQQQRVALARALANAPALLLADEPTGNLDSDNATRLLDVLAALVAEGQTVVMVTHEPGAVARAARRVCLKDGQIVDDGRTRDGH